MFNIYTLLREVDLRQLSEKAQLSVELVTMCLESASELQAGTIAVAFIPNNDH